MTRELGQNDVKRFLNKVNLYFMTVGTAKLFKGTLGLTVNGGAGRNRLIVIIVVNVNDVVTKHVTTGTCATQSVLAHLLIPFIKGTVCKCTYFISLQCI